MTPHNPADRPATEPRTKAGRRMLHRRSYWSGNNAIREAILAIENEARANVTSHVTFPTPPSLDCRRCDEPITDRCWRHD